MTSARRISGLVLSAVMAAQPAALAAELTLNENSRNEFLAISGRLEMDTDYQLRRLYQSRHVQKPVVLILNTPGGALDELAPLTNAILELADLNIAKTKYPLVVVFHLYCGSVCTILAANITKHRVERNIRILVDPELRFGFHAPMQKVEGGFREYGVYEREMEANRMIRAYEDAGVSKAWLLERRDMLTRSALTFIPAADICVKDIGIVPPEACLNNNEDLFHYIDALFDRGGERLRLMPEPSFGDKIVLRLKRLWQKILVALFPTRRPSDFV